MRRVWFAVGAITTIALAGPAYVMWATWDMVKRYEQGDMGDE
jgi:hypothetical protein